MEEIKNKSIADTFNAKLKTSWVWLVVVITLGLTVLFYFSQKPQIVMYSQYIKALSEYQLQEAQIMRSLEHVRTGFGADSSLIQSQTMILREMMVSFSREVEVLGSLGSAVPPSSMTARFERQVLSKVAGMRRYSVARMAWMEKWEIMDARLRELPWEQSSVLSQTLDSARAGFPVSIPAGLPLPDSLQASLDSLLLENLESATAWSKFDNELTLMSSMDLIHFFQMESLNEINLKSKIPMVFYFLSLVLLLSTFFFLFRSRL